MPSSITNLLEIDTDGVSFRDNGDVHNDSVPEAGDAFRHAAVSLSLSDQNGRILDANDAFYELFGHDRTAALDVGMLSRSGDQDWTVSYLTRLVTGEIPEFRTVKRFVRADASEFDGDLAVRAIRDDGQCIGLIASIEPAEVRPTVDNARVRKLLEHAAGTLTLVDVEGAVIETSGRYRETLGYPAEFWEDRTILDIVVPEDLAPMLEMRDEVLKEPGQSLTRDFRVASANRSIETLEVTALNMLDDPDLGGIVLSTRNVTAERLNTEAIAALRDEAVAEADERSRMVATVSHELRNPLHAMSGLAELLASDPLLGPAQSDLAESLLRQLKRLTSVTDDLLDTARLEVGRFELRPAPVVVRDLINDVVRTGRSAADGRIDVVCEIDDDVPHLITVDPARLQQVLGNLVGNAVKFTDVGSVRLTATVGADDAGVKLLEFEVADTGMGIPPEQIARVFQPFSSSTTSGDRRGAGLGLAIVQRLVEAFGGDVFLRSELGEGTSFTVSIPLVGATPEDTADAPDIAERDNRRRVLVVEDTPVNQQLAQHQLARLDMDCVIAESAEIGLEILSSDTFDVILMDHQLPGMNGRDATQEIRRRGIEIPVVGVTASSTAADERACLDAGMNAFLAKPVGLERLSEALQSVFRDDEQAAAGEPTSPDAAAESDDAVDTSVLDALAAELGDRTIVEGLVRTFLNELDSREVDIATGDAELAARQAHTLKSSAKLLGAGRLSDVCAAAEGDATVRPEITQAAHGARLGLSAWLDSADDHPETDPVPAP